MYEVIILWMRFDIICLYYVYVYVMDMKHGGRDSGGTAVLRPSLISSSLAQVMLRLPVLVRLLLTVFSCLGVGSPAREGWWLLSWCRLPCAGCVVVSCPVHVLVSVPLCGMGDGFVSWCWFRVLVLAPLRRMGAVGCSQLQILIFFWVVGD